MTRLKALIDADLLIYRAGFAGDKDLKACFGNINIIVKSILYHTEAYAYEAFLTSNDKSNYRFKIAQTQPYKGNRKDAAKPFHYVKLRQYMMDKHHAHLIVGEEADDALGIFQEDDTIICSIDKDLNMIPGWHYNFVKKEKYYVTDNDPLNFSTEVRGKRKVHKMDRGGIKWFYAQMLLGDTADNIPGIRGMGPVAVAAALEGCETELDMARKVWDTYKKNELSEKQYLEVADLLWIRRKPNEMKSEELAKWLI